MSTISTTEIDPYRASYAQGNDDCQRGHYRPELADHTKGYEDGWEVAFFAKHQRSK